MSVALQEICIFAPSSKLTGKGNDFVTNGVPFYTSSSVQERYYETPTHFGPALIIGAAGSANVHYCEGPFAVTKSCYVLTLKNEAASRFDLEFIYYYLHSNIRILELGFQGVGVKQLPRNYVAELMIPELLLARQHKVIDILKRLQTIIHKNEESISKLDKIAQMLFYRDFGDPILDNRFPKRPLNEMVQVEIGANIPQEALRARESEASYYLLKQSAVSGLGYFDETQCKAIYSWQPEWSRYLVRTGDLLFSRSNTPDLAGTAVYVFETAGNKLFPSTVYRIQCDWHIISGIYLSYVFNAENFHRYLQSYQTGTVVSMSNIPKTDLLKFEIPVPDMSSQQKFEQGITQINQLIGYKKVQLKTLECLLTGLAPTLFRETDYLDIKEELISLLQSSIASGELPVDDFRRLELRQKLLEMIRTASESFGDVLLYDQAKEVLFALLDNQMMTQTMNAQEQRIDIHLS